LVLLLSAPAPLSVPPASVIPEASVNWIPLPSSCTVPEPIEIAVPTVSVPALLSTTARR
jgi:hypothetical protein